MFNILIYKWTTWNLSQTNSWQQFLINHPKLYIIPSNIGALCFCKLITSVISRKNAMFLCTVGGWLSLGYVLYALHIWFEHSSQKHPSNTRKKRCVLCLFVWVVSEFASAHGVLCAAVVPVLCWEQEYQVSSVCTMCTQCFLCVLLLSAQSSATSNQHASLHLPSKCVCVSVTSRTQCADFIGQVFIWLLGIC